MPRLKGVVAVAKFYAFGIFSGGEHPYHKTVDKKHNPLQGLAYLALLSAISPIIWVSGCFTPTGIPAGWAVSCRWMWWPSCIPPGVHGGASSLGEETLQLADGSTLPDRTLAEVFPSTYVLGRHGVVVFAITGAAQAWEEYLPLLHDVVSQSGQ